ncbi:SpoIIE family protein phosphatase [Desulfobacterota bacterium AH_259_B03_O07]|nr:SpoIIE family protein phosphatase [Desulfobacterota bacterium AH_259_B03_O07]
MNNVRENSKNLAFNAVNRIETILKSFEKIPENLAYFLKYSDYTKSELTNLIRTVVENNSEIFGSTIAFEPYAFDKNSEYFAPYFYKDNGDIKFTYLGGDTYRYFHWDWYQIPKELDKPQWSEPYYDEGGGNIIMSTYSVPFYKNIEGKKKFMGIVTADISLDWLEKIVSSIEISKTGYGFLISKNGTFVTHPDSDLIMNETLFSLAEAREDQELREIGRRMISRESDFVPLNGIISNKKFLMFFAPLSTSGWSVGVLFPQDELMSDITRLNRNVFLIGIAGLLILLILIILISGSITKPLRILVGATNAIAGGNLDVELPMSKSNDEVGKLTNSFLYMEQSLKKYIKELTETTAAKERIESELNVAREIQMSILPKTFPPFPDRNEFEIFAAIEPAKEVGGDFYDFFFTDKEHLFFCIGDVSGKGVPAALFMAVTKTLIKAKTTSDISPDEVLTRVNKELCIDNETAMFVTIFCGILNTRTGGVSYSNGGHNPPYLFSKNNGIKVLDGSRGMALGILDEASYTTGSVTLNAGDGIFLYTDGVTEAMDIHAKMYTDENLHLFLEKQKAINPEETILKTLIELKNFSSGTAQADDITIMSIKYLS